jgi:membrane protein
MDKFDRQKRRLLQKLPQRQKTHLVTDVLQRFIGDLGNKRIGMFASSAAYFFFMALIPLAALICSMIPLSSLSSSDVIYFLMGFIPAAMEDFVTSIVMTAWESASGGIATLSFLATLWLASVAMVAIIHGLDEIYEVAERRSYFVVRGLACLYTVIFLTVIIVLIVMMVFGKMIAGSLSSSLALTAKVVELLISERYLISTALLLVIFQCCYTFLPAGHRSFFSQLPGAVFSALLWAVGSFIFSAWTARPGAYSIYGSLAMVIITLSYLYVMLYIVLLGAEVNVFFGRHDLDGGLSRPHPADKKKHLRMRDSLHQSRNSSPRYNRG